MMLHGRADHGRRLERCREASYVYLVFVFSLCFHARYVHIRRAGWRRLIKQFIFAYHCYQSVDYIQIIFDFYS